jgi:Zn-dependent protease with chaperone function
MTNDKPKNISLSRQQELMNVFDFTWHDLAANREGRITEVQKKKVMRLQGSVWNPMMWIFSFMLIMLFAFVFWISLSSYLSFIELINTGIYVPFSIIGLLISVFIVAAWYSKQKIWRDLQTEIVETIQGIAIVETDPRGLAGSITIHDVRMQARRECILRIKHLEPHVIHYLPNSKVIVSVEVMEQ